MIALPSRELQSEAERQLSQAEGLDNKGNIDNESNNNGQKSASQAAQDRQVEDGLDQCGDRDTENRHKRTEGANNGEFTYPTLTSNEVQSSTSMSTLTLVIKVRQTPRAEKTIWKDQFRYRQQQTAVPTYNNEGTNELADNADIEQADDDVQRRGNNGTDLANGNLDNSGDFGGDLSNDFNGDVGRGQVSCTMHQHNIQDMKLGAYTHSVLRREGQAVR